MGAHAIVTLVITGLALAVVAGYLIHIARILWHVIEDLVVILGAVEDVSTQSAPAGPVIDDISRNLASAAASLEGSVQRLAERRAPAAAAAMAAAAERRYIPGDAHRMPSGQTVPAGHHPGRAPDFGFDSAPALATPPPATAPDPTPAAAAQPGPPAPAAAPPPPPPAAAPEPPAPAPPAEAPTAPQPPAEAPTAPQPPAEPAPPTGPPPAADAPPQGEPGSGEDEGDDKPGSLRWWRNR